MHALSLVRALAQFPGLTAMRFCLDGCRGVMIR
jgi:hypothetical protein